jgi:riboflavin biosynthesis pyrimidine reductase
VPTSRTSTRSEAVVLQRLLPDPGETTIAEQLAGFRPEELAHDERPYVFTNFAVTVDGEATIDGRAGPIGSRADLEMLLGLRAAADAVLIGAGTMRAERYGRLIPDGSLRARRERRGLPHDPLAVLLTDRMELPWDAGLFSSGSGRVLIFTGSQAEAPETATPVRVVRHRGSVDLREALRYLREDRGIRGLLCEGGPHTHGGLIAGDLLDELFVTFAPKLSGGGGPGLVEGLPEQPRGLELRWLLHEDGELFARYAVS